MCDVKRQLSKFHTTIRLPDNVKAGQKLAEKAMSYVATDGNTPVIGELCQRVLVLSPEMPQKLHGIGNWWAKFEKSVQYPNTNVDGWMDVEFEHLLPTFDRVQFNNWLDGIKSAKELLSPPLCDEPKRPTPALVPVVVDEEIIPPRSPSRAREASETGDERILALSNSSASPLEENWIDVKSIRAKKRPKRRKTAKPPIVRGQPGAKAPKQKRKAPVVGDTRRGPRDQALPLKDPSRGRTRKNRAKA
jgi:hypothetical protein